MWDPPGTNIYEEDGSWKYLSRRHQINPGVIFASSQFRIKGIVVGLRCVCGGGILRPSGNSSYWQRCEQWQGWYPCCQSSSFSQLLASTMAFTPPSSVHQHQQCCWFSIHPFICISSPQPNFSSLPQLQPQPQSQDSPSHQCSCTTVTECFSCSVSSHDAICASLDCPSLPSLSSSAMMYNTFIGSPRSWQDCQFFCYSWVIAA